MEAKKFRARTLQYYNEIIVLMRLIIQNITALYISVDKNKTLVLK